MKRFLIFFSVAVICCTAFSGCADNSSKTTEVASSENNTEVVTTATNNPTSLSTTQSTEKPTEQIFDVTQAYTNKPYSNDFALQRIDQLQYIDDNSLYYLFSDNESPVFYDGFYYENDTFENVNVESYEYDIDSETYRKYCDTYQYSQFANRGAIKVIDSFVYQDTSSNKMLYYCYYTVTQWGEGETLDTLDYYRDVITLDISTKSLTQSEKIAIKTQLQVPKSITGYHDFHGVI
ncbi:MAG: hypothetical protein UH241_08095 [Acutalibacteraceae bacterium]|nr:hypothetical protein [Acutalibacteraceae bacterium]